MFRSASRMASVSPASHVGFRASAEEAGRGKGQTRQIPLTFGGAPLRR